jgi:hypothetical protein
MSKNISELWQVSVTRHVIVDDIPTAFNNKGEPLDETIEQKGCCLQVQLMEL